MRARSTPPLRIATLANFAFLLVLPALSLEVVSLTIPKNNASNNTFVSLHQHPHKAILLEDNGETLLTGPVVDQASLHGVLRKVRDLGMLLLSVNRVPPDQTETPHAKE